MLRCWTAPGAASRTQLIHTAQMFAVCQAAQSEGLAVHGLRWGESLRLDVLRGAAATACAKQTQLTQSHSKIADSTDAWLFNPVFRRCDSSMCKHSLLNEALQSCSTHVLCQLQERLIVAAALSCLYCNNFQTTKPSPADSSWA